MRKFYLGILFLFFLGLTNSLSFSAARKRDPFVPLVDSSGRIKTEADLFRPVEVLLPINITLKGIIWSKDRPLAIINGKIYREGAQIFEGLILEKINPDHIILNDRGNKVKFYLRKKEIK